MSRVFLLPLVLLLSGCASAPLTENEGLRLLLRVLIEDALDPHLVLKGACIAFFAVVLLNHLSNITRSLDRLREELVQIRRELQVKK